VCACVCVRVCVCMCVSRICIVEGGAVLLNPFLVDSKTRCYLYVHGDDVYLYRVICVCMCVCTYVIFVYRYVCRC